MMDIFSMTVIQICEEIKKLHLRFYTMRLLEMQYVEMEKIFTCMEVNGSL